MTERPPDFPKAAWRVARQLETTHDLVQMTPNRNASLSYELVVPKGWAIVEKAHGGLEGPAKPLPIGLFLSERTGRGAVVSVVVMDVNVEVDLLDFAHFAFGRDGWEVLRSETHDTPGARVVDLGAVRTDEEGRFVARAMAQADGARVFVVSGICRREEWDRWKDDLLVACVSFRLLAPTGADGFEPLQQWEGGDPGFGVAAPLSWDFDVPPGAGPGRSAVDAKLTDGDRLLAYLNVRGIARAEGDELDDEAVLGASESLLRAAGFRASAARVHPAHDPQGDLLDGWDGTAVLAGTLNGAPAEARLGVREGPTLALAFTLLSPTQVEDEIVWMRAKRAFELARERCWPLPPRPS